jgi:hypothetical protein
MSTSAGERTGMVTSVKHLIYLGRLLSSVLGPSRLCSPSFASCLEGGLRVSSGRRFAPRRIECREHASALRKSCLVRSGMAELHRRSPIVE